MRTCIYMSFVLAFIGASTASLLCLVVDRTLTGERRATTHSHCACGRELSIFEVLPVVSWVWLRGVSRCCKRRLPVRWPLEELAGGMGFFFSTWLNPLYGTLMCFIILGGIGSVELLSKVSETKQLASPGELLRLES
jgi:prepilin signal peptidase PulO-like enzyme (type II secretory pathway)